MIAPRTSPRRRRGTVVVITLWAISIAAIVSAAVQLSAYRQASLGRESLHRVQARWAARAGLEQTIAVMAAHTESPIPDDAYAMMREMEYVAYGDMHMATYDIHHYREGHNLAFDGPMDEHAKLNVNLPNIIGFLVVLEDMTIDVATAVGDWMDDDDEATELGAERDYYLSLESPYEPRNEPLRTLAEFELIAGVWPSYFRGEDWNLNNKLDANENDGGRSLPVDEPDGELDAGWSMSLTAYSVPGGATLSGLPRIRLRTATTDDLLARLDITIGQAEALLQFGRSDTNVVESLVHTPLGGTAAASGNGPSGAGGEPLTDEQINEIIGETIVQSIYERTPGRVNINTVSADLLRRLLVDYLALDDAIVEEILYIRGSRPEGILSMLDLREIQDMEQATFQQLADLFTTQSNVFTVTTTGRSAASGLEVEIIAVVDRSTLPVRIIEYREQ
ncbi:MAG: hypothetical protein ACYTGG_13025 [Planctomycetota bacterium]|jgi:type II secretory pathway component PulK